ncbi:hypothetical protein GYMLUDRAFT_247444 [Collybiopsis luxurians FD-317 M1]|uniref:Uncharacterized protein n=1 Tax=Collybiopsis luxurians FD-317 M1 TaxID=944289 RepID=A0A0D0BPB2_9AGAR|nr:hypothetical protein GYMLUDRAFT_247444 [Collybiopsis luxurians FD-317 M1]
MSEQNLGDVQIQVRWDHYIELVGLGMHAPNPLEVLQILTSPGALEIFSDSRKPQETPCPTILHQSISGSSWTDSPSWLVFLAWANFPPGGAQPQLGIRNMELVVQIMLVVMDMNIIVLFVIRVTALYGGSRPVKVFLSIMGMCSIFNAAVQLYLVDRQSVADVDSKPLPVLEQIGNEPIMTISQGHFFAYIWAGVFAFDLCVFCLTLRKILGLSKYERLLALIMRDGLVYFGIISIMTLANILMFVFGPALLKVILSIGSIVLSSILLSRMMLNLREHEYSNHFSTVPSQLSGLVFTHPDTEIEPVA